MAEQIREMFPALVEVEQAEGDARHDAQQPPLPAIPRLTELGDYRIVREVGRGGMGVVYEAEQISLGRQVALKVLPGHLLSDRKVLERFRREAKAAARLHHTNIVPVYEVGQQDGVAFYAMQFIQGQGLDQVIGELGRLRRRDGKPAGDTCSGSGPHAESAAVIDAAGPTHAGVPKPTVAQVAASLLSGWLATETPQSATEAAHAATEAAGTDSIKPSALKDAPFRISAEPNAGAPPAPSVSVSAVLPGGTAVSSVESSSHRRPYFRSVAQIGRQVAQGLAYAHSRGVVHRDIKPSNLLLDVAGVVWITDFGLAKADEDGLTATGDILGTLRYMAPERFRGQGDTRADVYALGLTLYELLTLRPAFDTSNRLKLIERIKSEDPPRPRSLDGRVPRDLETIVLKASDKDPDRRYASADAMAEDLRRFLADEPIKARQVSTSERYWRWARRNPVIATLGGLLTGLLIAVTVGSLIAASRYQAIAKSETAANIRSQLDRQDAIAARRQAVEQRDKSLQFSASLALEKGIALGEEGRADYGLHWMLEALETAPSDAVRFRKTVLWNVGAWLGQVHKPLRISEKVDTVTDIGFSPDGKMFATGFDPRDRERATPIALWDTASGTKIKTLAGAFAPLAFSADGKIVFAVAEPASVAAVEIATARVLWKTPALDGESMLAIDVTPDGSAVLARRGRPDELAEWFFRLDAASGQPRGKPLRLPGIDAVNPSGTIGAGYRIADGELGIALYELTGGRQLRSWPSAGSRADWMQFSPDGGALYGSMYRAGPRNQSDVFVAQAWDAARGKEIGPLMASTIVGLYTPASDRLLTNSNSLWLVRGVPDALSRGAGFAVGWAERQSLHPEARLVIDSTKDGFLRLWQISDEAEPAAEARSTSRLSMAQTQLDREIGYVNMVQGGFVSDGRIAVSDTAGVSGRELVRVTDLATGRTVGIPSPHHAGWMIRALALSPDGRLFATGSNPFAATGELRVYDAHTGRLHFPPLPLTNYVSALAFHPDGKVLASGDFSGQVRFWDLATGREAARPFPQGEIVLSLAFSPDGKWLAVGLAQDHTGHPGIRLWDTTTGQPKGEILPATNAMIRLAYRPDGRALAGFYEHYTQLWDTIRGQPLSRPMVDESPGAFSPDSRTLVTLGTDGTVKLRDATTGAVLSRLLTASSRAVCAAFRGAGDLVAVGFQDGSVRLCDPATAQPVGPPRFMNRPLNNVVFSPDGQSLSGIDNAGSVRTWRVPRPLADEVIDTLRLRIEARTGLTMESGRTIARLDTAAWRERLIEVGRLDPTAAQPDTDPAWHEPMIVEAEQNGNNFAAIWHLDRLIIARPDDWFLRARRGRAWCSSGQFDKAAADYQEAERLGKRDDILDFQVHCVLGCSQAERWEEALWYLDRLIAARPDDRILHEDRAAVYGKLGREAERRGEIARVFELGADEGLVVPRATELARAGRWAEAANLLARCGRKGPVSRELAQAWAIACLNAGNLAGYREACAAFMAQEVPEPTVIWNALAAASLLSLASGAIDDHPALVTHFENRLPRIPASRANYRHWYANALGGLLLRAGKVDEAIARVKEAIAAKAVEVPTDWGYLAVACARKGRFDEARDCLKRLRVWLANPALSFWDVQELTVLLIEAESLIFDAEFPADPFQVLKRIPHFRPLTPKSIVALFNSAIPCFVTRVPVRSRRRATGTAPSFCRPTSVIAVLARLIALSPFSSESAVIPPSSSGV